MTNFKLRAIHAKISKLSTQLKQDAITTANIAKIVNEFRFINDEKEAASKISEEQKIEYKNLSTKIKECVKNIEKLTLAKDRQTLVNLFQAHQAAIKKTAAMERAAQQTLGYDD